MPFTVYEAFCITANAVELGILADEVSPEEWEKSKDEMARLAQSVSEFGGGVYYVLFLNPLEKTLTDVTDVTTLHECYDTAYRDEDTLWIRPKK